MRWLVCWGLDDRRKARREDRRADREIKEVEAARTKWLGSAWRLGGTRGRAGAMWRGLKQGPGGGARFWAGLGAARLRGGETHSRVAVLEAHSPSPAAGYGGPYVQSSQNP